MVKLDVKNLFGILKDGLVQRVKYSMMLCYKVVESSGLLNPPGLFMYCRYSIFLTGFATMTLFKFP